MHNSGVSIVIPTYNRADLVGRAIETALSQTVPCEVVVCDHGSTDGTSEVVRRYGERITYVRREDDHGPIVTWLDGVLHARGEYIHITYDDDWIDERFIERCMELMTPSCGFVFSASTVHWSNGEEVAALEDLFDTGTHCSSLIEAYILGMDLTISPGCAVFRKADVVRALMGGAGPACRNTYHGAGPDLLMFLMPLLRYSSFGYVNERLAHFRAHDGSITIDALQDAERQRKLMRAYDDVREYYLRARYPQKRDLAKKLYFRWKMRGRSAAKIGSIRCRRLINLWNGAEQDAR